ncbi:hypothetical protein QT786_19585, partial [Xanthomonas citri pv. citri]
IDACVVDDMETQKPAAMRAFALWRWCVVAMVRCGDGALWRWCVVAMVRCGDGAASVLRVGGCRRNLQQTAATQQPQPEIARRSW